MCNIECQDYFGDDRHNDPAIEDGDRLIRHCRTPVQVVPCAINGHKISDQAFKPGKGDAGLSIDLERLLLNQGLTAMDRFGVMPNTFAMLAVTAADARQHASGVCWTPKPAQPELAPNLVAAPNVYHGEIVLPMTPKSGRALYALSVVVHTIINNEAGVEN